MKSTLSNWNCRSRARIFTSRLYSLERSRPRHPHPEASQSRVRKAAVSAPKLPGRRFCKALLKGTGAKWFSCLPPAIAAGLVMPLSPSRNSRYGRRLHLGVGREQKSSEVYSNRGSFSGCTQSRMDRACPGVLSMRPLRSKVLIMS
jgi:hypothetical protein